MIRGRRRTLEKVQEVKANLDCSIHNRFDVEVIDAVTREVKQRAQAENVICNSLWARMFNATPTNRMWNNCIHYGTGSGAPSETDTSLFTFLGYGTPLISDDVRNYNWDEGWTSVTRKIQLSESTAVGSTLTEVGIGYGTGSTALVTHAMLRDMNGNQISITKTSTDIINIYATVFVHWNASGFDYGNIVIVKDKSNLFLTALLGLSSTNGVDALQLHAGGILGAMNYYLAAYRYHATGNTVSYNAANKQISVTAARVSVTNGNIAGGVACASLGYSNSYCSLTLKAGGTYLPSSDITGEPIGTGNGSMVNFATDFPFISNVKVYCDGVEQTTGVTVDENTPQLIDKMGCYFELLDSNADNAYMIAEGINSLNDASFPANKYCIFYNPYYTLGIASYKGYNTTKVEVSDDLSAWVTLSTGNGGVSVPEEYQNSKYWKFTKIISGSAYAPTTFTTAGATANNIHFTTAPSFRHCHHRRLYLQDDCQGQQPCL